MNIFVAGGTGAIGRPLISQLVQAGHDVTALTRSKAGAAAIGSQGATAAMGDALEPASLEKAVVDAKPEVVINQLTSLSQSAKMGSINAGLLRTARLRTQATPVLARAAAAAGARRLISQSISFAYRPGPGIRTEDDPLYSDCPPKMGELVGSLVELERATIEMAGLEGVVLRYGTLYGPGTYYARNGAFTELISARKFPIAGQGRGMWGFVHVDDAATATLASLNAQPGIFNIVDSVPAPTTEWMPHMASLIGARPPRRLPVALVRLVAGPGTAYYLDGQPEVSNSKAKDVLGWKLKYNDWHDGFRETLGD